MEQTKNHYDLVSVLDMLMILVPSILGQIHMVLFRVRVNNNKQNWVEKLKLAMFATQKLL